MTLYLARSLMPMRSQQDWPQDRLAYLPSNLYAPLISFKHFLKEE